MQLSRVKEQKTMKKQTDKQTLGMMIATLRKEKGMTQLDLAEKMGLTDKAVSKWERNLSCPDINAIPQLADVLGVSVEELMQAKKEPAAAERLSKGEQIVDTALKGVGIAMGIAVTVLTFLNQIETRSAIVMLGIGLSCLAISALQKREE